MSFQDLLHSAQTDEAARSAFHSLDVWLPPFSNIRAWRRRARAFLQSIQRLHELNRVPPHFVHVLNIPQLPDGFRLHNILLASPLLVETSLTCRGGATNHADS